MAKKTTGMLSIKTRLEYESATPGTYTPIAQVRSISGPSESDEQVDITTFDDDARVYIPGLGGSSQVTLGLVYNKAVRLALRALKGVEKNYRIVYPDNGATVFTGILSALGAEMSSPESAITCSATLTVTGPVTDVDLSAS